MTYQIDQSGKIEDTHRLTVVAYANGKAKSLKISAVEKQKLIQIMREITRPKKTFIYKIFGASIFILLQDSKISEVIIDKEYPGQEMTIKNVVIQLFDKIDLRAPEIRFGNIGKKSKAHKIALETFQGKRKADIIITAEEILQLFYGN